MTTSERVFRLPLRLGDLSGPSGNAFAIFGAIKACGKQVGTSEALSEASRLISKFMEGTYEEGLDMLRQEAEWLDDEGSS